MKQWLFGAGLGLVLASSAFVGIVQAQGIDVGGPYQIVKATEDRVWRLNKETGEIAVCTLEGANLVCTNSSEAITPPSKTFEEREAERAAAATSVEEQRKAKREEDLAFMNRIIDAIKSLINEAPAE